MEYKCKYCERSFKTKQARSGHLAYCNKDVYINCYICGNKICKNTIKSHIEKHNKRVPCTVCGNLTNNKKFCSSSCSAKYNNKKRTKIKYCINCNNLLNVTYKKYCDNKCQQEYGYKNNVYNWKNNINQVEYTTMAPNWLRLYLFKKYNNKCCKCGWDEINPYTGKIPLEVEHIDGNYSNNKEENLELLCPNCHSLTSTYKGANKGNGRHYRRERYKNGKSF